MYHLQIFNQAKAKTVYDLASINLNKENKLLGIK